MLERLDIADECRAGEIPLRHRPGEAVFDHPLPKRFADSDRLIAIAEIALDLIAVGLGDGRRDAVDHGRGEGCVDVDPLQKGGAAALCQRAHDRAEDGAVGRDVVATQ